MPRLFLFPAWQWRMPSINGWVTSRHAKADLCLPASRMVHAKEHERKSVAEAPLPRITDKKKLWSVKFRNLCDCEEVRVGIATRLARSDSRALRKKGCGQVLMCYSKNTCCTFCVHVQHFLGPIRGRTKTRPRGTVSSWLSRHGVHVSICLPVFPVDSTVRGTKGWLSNMLPALSQVKHLRIVHFQKRSLWMQGKTQPHWWHGRCIPTLIRIVWVTSVLWNSVVVENEVAVVPCFSRHVVRDEIHAPLRQCNCR